MPRLTTEGGVAASHGNHGSSACCVAPPPREYEVEGELAPSHIIQPQKNDRSGFPPKPQYTHNIFPVKKCHLPQTQDRLDRLGLEGDSQMIKSQRTRGEVNTVIFCRDPHNDRFRFPPLSFSLANLL